MTAREARALVAAGAIAAAGSVGILWASGATDRPESSPPAPECLWSHDLSAWHCAIPTPALPARIIIQAWEDGSARVTVIDPDSPGATVRLP